MHDCASILYSIAKGFPCFRNFSHGASHPYIPIHSLWTIYFMVRVNAGMCMCIYMCS